MDTEKLITRYPMLWHMAACDTWPKIREQGLLSTTALLNWFGYSREKRQHIESEWRPESVPISHPEHGTAVIRDNGPMPEHLLRLCLEDLSPREWYELLNRKVFFWATKDRLKRMLDAYGDCKHDVIVVDSRLLIARDINRITLSHINSGGLYLPNPSKRGSGTFQSIQEFDKGTIAELAVDKAVCDLEEITLRVDRYHGSERQFVLWERPTI